MADRVPGFGEFRNRQTNEPIYTNGSATERLAATLNDQLTAEPSAQAQRQEAEEKAIAQVDAKWPQEKIVVLANAVLAAGAAQSEETQRQKAAMYPESFLVWKGEADERLAVYLLSATAEFKDWIDFARQRAPKAVRPFPVTGPDISALSIRLNQLDGATPTEARGLIEDAITRDDAAFLVQAASNLRSWLAYRNAWQSPDAKAIGNTLLQNIGDQAWTPEAKAAEYTHDRADRTVSAWRRLVMYVQKDYRVEPIHRQVGEFSPIFEAGF